MAPSAHWETCSWTFPYDAGPQAGPQGTMLPRHRLLTSLSETRTREHEQRMRIEGHRKTGPVAGNRIPVPSVPSANRAGQCSVLVPAHAVTLDGF